MIKKYSKYIIASICVFFVSLMTSAAKEVSIDELTDMVKEINSSASHVYVIGEYAFTSKHTLTTQDIMLAARSIKVNDNTGKTNSDAIYNEMIITYLEGAIGSDWKLESLEFNKNVVGPNNEPAKYDIKFIDYNKVYSKVDVNNLVKKAYNTIKEQSATDKFIISMDGSEINIILKDLEMSSIDALIGTGVSTAALNFLKEEGIKSVTLSLDDENVTIGEELNESEIDAFFKALGKKAEDLVGKAITAKVEFDDDYKTANSEIFTINFGKLIDVDSLVAKAYETIKKQAATDKFVIARNTQNDNIIEVTLMDLEMSSIDALMGTGVSTAASKFLKEQGIEKVEIVYVGSNGNSYLTIKKDELDKDEVEKFFKELGSSAKDLINKTLYITVSFADGFDTLNSNKFDISFKDANKVDVDTLVDKAYNTIKDEAATDLFKISKENNSVNIIIKDLQMDSINAIAGSGIATAALNFLNEEGIKSVTLSLGEEKITINEELNQEEIEKFFKAIGKKAEDLVGKTMTATVAFEDGYKSANSKEFTINFGKYIDVDALVNKAYKIIEGQSAKDKFVAEIDGTDIDITIMNLDMASADALIGTGAYTAISNFLKEEGIASVKITIEGQSLTVGNTIDADELEAFLKKFGKKAGDLVGKTMTAEIAFENGFDTKNSEEFNVIFSDAIKVDVDSLVNKAYKVIEDQVDKNKFLVDTEENFKVIITDLNMSSIDALMGTGVATAAKNFLKEDGIAGVILEIDGKKLIIGNTIDEDEIEVFLKQLGTTASDLVGKTMNVEVLFEDGYKTANSTSFAVEIAKVEEVEVEKLVEKAYKVVEKQAAKDKFITKLNGTEIELMLVDLEMNSVDALTGTGVATAALNFINEKGIKEVTLTLDGKSLTIGEELNENEIEEFFKTLGKKAGDLVGKTITAKITLNKGFEVVNKDEFTIKITEEDKVNVENIVKESFEIVKNQVSENDFVVSLKGTKAEVIMMNLEMDSISALKGTGIPTAAKKFLAQEGVAGVVLELNGKELKIGNSIDAAEVEAFLKTFGNKASDLVGKTINATVLFEEGYKKAVSDKFTIELKDANKVDVANLVTSAYNKISNIQNNIFEVSMVDEAEVEVYLKDLEATSVEVLLGSKVGEAALNILKAEGVKNVCLNYNEYELCLTEDTLNANNVQSFFNNLGSKAGDLLNKSIGITINFDAGYKTGNIEGLNVTFLKTKFNVNFDVDGNVTTSKVEVGDKALAPTVPTKEGYTFDKWLLNGTEYDFDTPITEEITLTASWNINTYKIKLVANDDAMGSVNVSEVEAEYGTEIEVSDNTITIGNITIFANTTPNNNQYTYSFVGWSDVTTPVKNSMTITANFAKTINKYTVTYTDSVGNTLGAEEVDYGTKISELNPPAEEGYVFDSFVDKNLTDVIESDVSLVVKYNEEIIVTNVVNKSLEDASGLVNKNIFDVAPLVEDVAKVDFKQEIAVADENGNVDIFKALQMDPFLKSVASLLETLASNEAYETVKFNYKGKELNLTTLTYDDISFSGFYSKTPSATAVAQFMSKVAGFSGGSGSDIMYISTEKLVAGTTDTPIDVIITLKEGYANSDGLEEVHYNLVFTESIDEPNDSNEDN